MTCLLYTYDQVLCGELEEDMRVMIGCFVEVCKRRDLKVNAEKEVLGGERTLL